jgi:hypothetical protein
MNASYSEQKPGLVTAIALMTLVSGIINLFWGFVASATALGTVVGVICLPLTILPTILGVFEIIFAAKLLSAQPQPVQPSPAIAVFEILTVTFGNVFSLIVGILTLIFYNDLTVKDYFARINGAAPIMPSAPVSPQPEPVIESLPEIVEQPEHPEKPKRTKKVVGK